METPPIDETQKTIPKPKRKRPWGYYRCEACRAFSRMECEKCEHCDAKPRNKKK